MSKHLVRRPFTNTNQSLDLGVPEGNARSLEAVFEKLVGGERGGGIHGVEVGIAGKEEVGRDKVCEWAVVGEEAPGEVGVGRRAECWAVLDERAGE